MLGGVEQRVDRAFEDDPHQRRRAGVADPDAIENEPQLRAGGEQAPFDLDTLGADERDAGDVRPARDLDPVRRRERHAGIVDPAASAKELGDVGSAHAKLAATVGERDQALVFAVDDDALQLEADPVDHR
ncbi:MAG TPA: hypothetical protein VH041_05980 [Caldimonas sp.]|nr:hypothetical protein [Caldimonas sp.]HEX4233837.1 hypothetical protein [Caldimonas sp.]